MRYNLVVDEDVKKPNKPVIYHKQKSHLYLRASPQKNEAGGCMKYVWH